MPEKEINGVKLYYEQTGDKNSDTAIFFLNGVMASTGSWSSMIPDFEKAGFRIVLHDFRGQLRSQKPEQPWSFDDHVEDLAGLMDYLGIKSASFIGTSYGGEVALYFAVKYPERCRSLSLIDSVSELNPLLEAAISSWITAAETGDGEAFYKLMLPWLFSSSYLGRNREELASRGKDVGKFGADYFKGQTDLYRTFLQVDITDQLHRITAPSIVICGEEDILKPPAFSEIIADNIPSSEMVLIPECGHVAIYEKAHELNNIIMDFLKRKGII